MNHQPSILVIDDETFICESCNRIFSQAGYKVDTYINSDSGLRQALMNDYDAIVLDLKLGENDGIELLRNFRKEKPEVPVFIITGYPTEESKRMSAELGVSDYILKPFEPNELLVPVQKITYKKPAVSHKTIYTQYTQEDIITKVNYRFFESSWFYQKSDELVLVGGHLVNSLNTSPESITLPEIGSMIYRGLPLAKVSLSNGIILIIPSAVCGKITGVNSELKKYPSILENSINKESWIAVVKPENLEEDIKASEIRKILILSKGGNEASSYFSRFNHMGYIKINAKSINTAIAILNKGIIKVVILDAISFMDYGPEYVKRINQEFCNTKIIVVNNPNSEFETLYRENRIFYYGVNPITNSEIADVLTCAFYDKRQNILPETNDLSLLPKTISRIRITNRYGQKVTLLAYDDILQNNGGTGRLLINKLTDRSYPLEVTHCRTINSFSESSEMQNILNEKEKNNRIIILRNKYLNYIPGSIIKETEEYKNSNGAINIIITFDIQPHIDSNNNNFDNMTTRSLADLIMNDMISTIHIPGNPSQNKKII